jgi:hypothetical protein
MLTVNQIDSLLNIVKFKHGQFIMFNLGVNFLSTADKMILRLYGIDYTKYKKVFSPIDYAFYFGLLAEALGNKRVSQMNFNQLKQFISSNKFVPLTEAETAALDYVKTRSYNDISNLSSGIQNKIGNVLAGRSVRKFWSDTLKEQSEKAIEERQSQNWLASQLGKITQDWERDFDRIANFIMHEAYDYGRAQYILNKFGADAKVYKDVYEEACESCVELYLEDGLGSAPKIFTLKELWKNGNNIGVKKSDWKPVIGSTHPWCRCTLSHVPENGSWNPAKKDFSNIQRNTYGVNRKSKAKLTITD